jgi:hypothetical protein
MAMRPTQQTFSIWYFVSMLIGLLLLQSLLFALHPENVSYSEFKALLAHGKASNVVRGKQTITGTLAPEGPEGLLPTSKIEEPK